MGDLRPDLERLGRRVEPDTDAFERLDRRRRRKERNGRVAAGGLALIVAVGGSLAALPRRQRAAIVLTELLGYGSEEAGAILGVKGVTVRALASQGRAAMRTRLERDDG